MKNRKKIELEETAGEREMRLSWKADAWNGRSTPESAAQSGALGVVGCSSQAPSAINPIDECVRLGTQLAHLRSALEEIQRSADGSLNNDFPEDAPDTLQHISGIVARALGSATERQPDSNDPDQPRAERKIL